MGTNNLKQHNIINIMRSYDFITLRKTICFFVNTRNFLKKNPQNDFVQPMFNKLPFPFEPVVKITLFNKIYDIISEK